MDRGSNLMIIKDLHIKGSKEEVFSYDFSYECGDEASSNIVGSYRTIGCSCCSYASTLVKGNQKDIDLIDEEIESTKIRLKGLKILKRKLKV